MTRSGFSNYKRKIIWILESHFNWKREKVQSWIDNNPKHIHYMWLHRRAGHTTAEFINTYPNRKED